MVMFKDLACDIFQEEHPILLTIDIHFSDFTQIYYCGTFVAFCDIWIKQKLWWKSDRLKQTTLWMVINYQIKIVIPTYSFLYLGE